MIDHDLGDADERRHLPGPEPDWEESWYFDFVARGGKLAGYARLGLRAGEGRAWWWTAIVGDDLPFVLVRDHDVDLPRAGGLEIRGSGLWAEAVLEDPFDHWSVGLEAFAIGFEEPAEALTTERGDPLPLGLDLGWEATGGPDLRDGGYAQACAVHGDVLVGRERLPVAGTGTREHRWGPKDWWGAPSSWVAGQSDPPALHPGPTGLLAPGGRLADGTPVTPLAHAPLQIPRPAGGAGPASRLARALCRLGGDGGELAWAERLQPASSTSF